MSQELVHETDDKRMIRQWLQRSGNGTALRLGKGLRLVVEPVAEGAQLLDFGRIQQTREEQPPPGIEQVPLLRSKFHDRFAIGRGARQVDDLLIHIGQAALSEYQRIGSTCSFVQRFFSSPLPLDRGEMRK